MEPPKDDEDDGLSFGTAGSHAGSFASCDDPDEARARGVDGRARSCARIEVGEKCVIK